MKILSLLVASAIGDVCVPNFEPGYCTLKKRYYIPYRQSCTKYMACPENPILSALMEQHICECPAGKMYDPISELCIDSDTDTCCMRHGIVERPCRAQINTETRLLMVQPEPRYASTYHYDWIDGPDNGQQTMSRRLYNPAMETPQYKVCSFSLMGKYYLMGSDHLTIHNTMQAYRIDDCGFTRLPNMPFVFEAGRCATIDEDTAILCAGIENPKQCFLYHGNDATYEPIAKSQFTHTMGDVVGWDGHAMLIAGHNKEVEVWPSSGDKEDPGPNNVWSSRGQMEVIQNKGYSQFYSVVMANRVYTFGGMDGDSVECEVDENCYFDSVTDKVYFASVDLSIPTTWQIHPQRMQKPRAWLKSIVLRADRTVILMDNNPNEIEKWEFDINGEFVTDVSISTESIPDTDKRDYWEVYELLPGSDNYNC